MKKLILSYTIQVVLANVCTKFRNVRCSCSRETFDTNFPMHYTGVRDGKKVKRSQEKFQQVTSTVFRCIQNLKTLALLGAEKSVTKHFIGEKKDK